MDGLSQHHSATLPAHPAGAVPLDAENKQRLEAAAQSKKTAEKVGDDLSNVLNRLADDIDSLDREKRLTLFRQQIKAHQYLDGNFYGYVDHNLEWKQREKGADEVWYSDNQLYPYWRTALMELSRTQTEVVINAPPGSDDQLVAAAKFAKSRYDANRDRTFNARLKQTSNSYALLNGIVFWYTFFQFENGRQERIPKLQKRESSGEIKKLCAMCSRPAIENVDITGGGNVPDPKCLRCGSQMFIEIGVDEQPDVVIGYEDIPNGQNAWIVPNPIGVIVSLQASCIQETPYLKWKQLILRSILQSKFKGIDLPSTGTESLELRYITNQQKATPAAENQNSNDSDSTSNSGIGRELELLEFQQVWLDYPIYCEIKFDKDISLGRGKTLKAGQTLGEKFPDGLYFARCGDLIVDIWNEDKNRKWSSSPYGMRAGSMYGSGSHTALSDQETINDIETLKMANAWANGVPKDFVDPNVIPELSSDPQIPTNFNSAALPPGRDVIGGGYQQVPAQSLSAEIYGISEKKESSIQNKIGAMSGAGAGGLADAQKWGDTATAISIKRDLAVGRFSPDLELMADQLDKEQAYQFLENEKQYFTPAQWAKCKGDHGDDALKAFLACDIRRDLIISIAPGSYMPKSDAQVQAKLVGYAQLLPALAQSQNPELLAYAAEVYGIPEHLGGWNSDRAHVGKVVKRFEALADAFIEQYGDLPDTSFEPIAVGTDETGQPVMAPSPALRVAQRINDYSRMPVDVFLDNHQAIIDALRDWRTTDEGRDASNALLAAVDYRLLRHQEGIAKQKQILVSTEMAGNAPVVQDEEAKQTKLLESQNAANAEAGEAKETEMLSQAADKVMEYADRDDEREHQAASQESKQNHEKDLEAARLLTAGASQQV